MDTITGRQLYAEIGGTIGLEDKDSRGDAHSDPSEMDNTLMQSVISGISEREARVDRVAV